MNEHLADRLEELLPQLIGGRAKGGEWIGASTREGGLGDSLNVALRGLKRGRWYFHAAGVGGDPLGLVNYVLYGNADMKKAFAWSRDFLGGKIEPETEKDREIRLRRHQSLARKEKREEFAKRGRARELFLYKATDKVAGTPAWHYLNNRLQGRLAELGHFPGCIRFVDRLYNAQLSTQNNPVYFPGMVAAIVNGAGEMIAAHRTWLVQRGPNDHDWDRLRPEDLGKHATRTSEGESLKGKKALGKYLGGTIRLWAGYRQNLDTGEIKMGVQWPRVAPGSSIMLCEGIETGLSLALAMRERRIVTTVSIDGFAHVELPPCFQNVTIAADRDPGNKATAAALERAGQVHTSAGRGFKIVYPPEGIDDWNTALKEIAGRAA